VSGGERQAQEKSRKIECQKYRKRGKAMGYFDKRSYAFQKGGRGDQNNAQRRKYKRITDKGANTRLGMPLLRWGRGERLRSKRLHKNVVGEGGEARRRGLHKGILSKK